jgi:hypothetical protein
MHISIKNRKPLTSKDRERYVHATRENAGMTAWTVQKSSFGQNDILGCIDTISYKPRIIYLDQTTSISNVAPRQRKIENSLKAPPATSSIVISVHGIDGYKEKFGIDWIPVITRHVQCVWLPDGSWTRTEKEIEKH